MGVCSTPSSEFSVIAGWGQIREKMVTDLIRTRVLGIQVREAKRQVVEIYGKLWTGPLYHYTDNSVIYANRQWEDTQSTDYTDKPHFHH